MSRDEENEGQAKSSIRIVDRRRFDSDGAEKVDGGVHPQNKSSSVAQDTSKSVSQKPVVAEVAAASHTKSGSANASTQQSGTSSSSSASSGLAQAKDPDLSVGDEEHPSFKEGTEDASSISFGSFVLSLATQALMQLGQLKAPDGMSVPVDPVAGKQTIDILGMLEAKTKGNLDAQESRLITEALYNLRVAYLRFR